jgi:hypothetical protein
MINFLHERCQILEAVVSSKGKVERTKPFPRKMHSYTTRGESSTGMKFYMC